MSETVHYEIVHSVGEHCQIVITELADADYIEAVIYVDGMTAWRETRLVGPIMDAGWWAGEMTLRAYLLDDVLRTLHDRWVEEGRELEHKDRMRVGA